MNILQFIAQYLNDLYGISGNSFNAELLVLNEIILNILH